MATPRRQLTQNQRARRARILAATRKLVTDHGYDGTIMRDVAARADVSATTLYNLYNTKDELLLEALRERISESARLAATDAPEPGYEYLLAHVHHVAQHTLAAPSYVAAISQALFRAAPGDALVDVLVAELRDNISHSLEQMRAAGELKPGINLMDLATRLAGAYWATFLLWSKGLIGLEALEPTMRQGYLSALIPCTQADVRADLEAQFNSAA